MGVTSFESNTNILRYLSSTDHVLLGSKFWVLKGGSTSLTIGSYV